LRDQYRRLSPRSAIASSGERTAPIYTIVQTAKLKDVNPDAYPRDMLAKIADRRPINYGKRGSNLIVMALSKTPYLCRRCHR